METNQNQAQATNEVPENLTPQQALAILVQGVQFAQTKGIYSLTDAELISKAVRVFTNQPEEGKEVAPPGTVAEEPSNESEATVENTSAEAPVAEAPATEAAPEPEPTAETPQSEAPSA